MATFTSRDEKIDNGPPARGLLGSFGASPSVPTSSDEVKSGETRMRLLAALIMSSSSLTSSRRRRNNSNDDSSDSDNDDAESSTSGSEEKKRGASDESSSATDALDFMRELQEYMSQKQQKAKARSVTCNSLRFMVDAIEAAALPAEKLFPDKDDNEEKGTSDPAPQEARIKSYRSHVFVAERVFLGRSRWAASVDALYLADGPRALHYTAASDVIKEEPEIVSVCAARAAVAASVLKTPDTRPDQVKAYAPLLSLDDARRWLDANREKDSVNSEFERQDIDLMKFYVAKTHKEDEDAKDDEKKEEGGNGSSDSSPSRGTIPFEVASESGDIFKLTRAQAAICPKLKSFVDAETKADVEPDRKSDISTPRPPRGSSTQTVTTTTRRKQLKLPKLRVESSTMRHLVRYLSACRRDREPAARPRNAIDLYERSCVLPVIDKVVSEGPAALASLMAASIYLQLPTLQELLQNVINFITFSPDSSPTTVADPPSALSSSTPPST